jgi:hypothetical protein
MKETTSTVAGIRITIHVSIESPAVSSQPGGSEEEFVYDEVSGRRYRLDELRQDDDKK